MSRSPPSDARSRCTALRRRYGGYRARRERAHRPERRKGRRLARASEPGTLLQSLRGHRENYRKAPISHRRGRIPRASPRGARSITPVRRSSARGPGFERDGVKGHASGSRHGEVVQHRGHPESHEPGVVVERAQARHDEPDQRGRRHPAASASDAPSSSRRSNTRRCRPRR